MKEHQLIYAGEPIKVIVKHYDNDKYMPSSRVTDYERYSGVIKVQALQCENHEVGHIDINKEYMQITIETLLFRDSAVDINRLY